ncbi:hypothetical protein BG015_004366 [Linnemannia schmuckeri]|uniref:Uncharacterized protein n=1 Tax=Linnemannia schmuckeri TaxID=64567 RepID=A0A9P5VD22_9FUNG|nr:hypothetical protein BG015_004366 [Linnemannia schmuckeri]
MTMQGYVRGGADRQRRSESNAAPLPTKLSAPFSSSHASRSTTHLSTIQASSRNGHLATASTSTSSSKNTASAALDHVPYNHKKYSGAGYQSIDSTGDKRKDIAIQQDQQLLLQQQQQQQQRAHQEEARHPRRYSNSNGRPENSNGSSSSSIVSSADANFRAGMKLIQQAYEEKYQSLIDEVNTWKWISEEQSAQMTAMAAELARVEDKYTALQKEMAQLEVFRKAIVSMVDQHSGVSLAELEQSILETIEADAENTGARLDAVADADTSSFILDGGIESPQAPYPHQHRSLHEDFSMREQKHKSLVIAKESPQSSSFRPRASTETSSSTLLSPSGLGGTRRGAQTLSDSSPNGQTKMHKSGSTDSLRNKRNTISTTSRSIYPNTPLSTGSANKRHSNATSPLNSRSRSGTASSRVVPASASFSSNSTPSTSPRQPTANSNTTSVITRTIRQQQQQQQQKEYSANVRNSMSQMATLSGGAPSNATHLDPLDRRQGSSDSSVSGQASDLGSTNRRGQRPPSSTAHSFSGLSPAAAELLKQQERQQRQEEKINLQKSPPGYLQQQQQDLHHLSEDEDRRRSVVYSQSRSHVKDRSLPTHHQSQPQHSIKANDTTLDRHHYQSGYESATRQQNETTRRRQSATFGDKAGTHSSTASSDGHQSHQSSGGVDANAFTLLYKEIRDSMDTQSFGMFARVVTAFNEGEKTTDETLLEVSKIVQDRALNQRFRDLIHKAIAEKENQLENGGANETMDGDVTLEIDHSLLLEEDEDRIDEGDEELAEDEKDGDLRDRDGDNGSDMRSLKDHNSLGRNDSGMTGEDEDDQLNHARDDDLNDLDNMDQSRLSIEGPSLLIANGEGSQGVMDSSRSDDWSGKPRH